MTIDYDKLIQTKLKHRNIDPLDFLSNLSSINLEKPDFGPSSFMGGASARKAGIIDSSFLEKEADICQIVRSAIEDKNIVPKDIRVDDSGLPQAKNFYDWMSNDQFCGSIITPYLEQMIWGVVLFGEYCPSCSDIEWLLNDHKVTDTYTKFERKVCMLEHGTCPSCKKTRSYWINKKKLNFYREIALRVGQRGGKSMAVGGMLSPYITHRVLKMQKPNAIYGLPASNVLHGTFVALTYAQAKDTLWDPYYGTLLESPWFQQYHSMLHFYGERYGEKLLKFNDTFVQYRHRALTVYPSGPDKRVLRGRTRIIASCDEIGYFDNSAGSDKVKLSAKEVYTALERSLLTVRASAEKLIRNGYDEALHGYFMNVSSPSSSRDMICELTRNAVGSKHTYGKVLPTWEVNPNITREDLAEEFRKDPVLAMRDYGAEPPLSANAFITNQTMLEEATSLSKRNGIIIKHQQRKYSDGTINRYAKILKLRPCASPTLLAIDGGYSSNSFACVVGKLGADSCIDVHVFVEVMPVPGIPLNYSLIYDEIITPLIEQCNVKVMLADRWNSLKLLSDATEDHGIVSRQYSLKYLDMCNVKYMFEQSTLNIPALGKGETVESVLNFPQDQYPKCFEHRPAEHFIVQCLTVQNTGSSVIKGDGGLTDDIWRAFCLMVWGLQEEEYIEIIKAAPDQKNKMNGMLGSARFGTGGKKSTGSNGAVSKMIGVVKNGR
jgi:hypothetical protein